MALKGKESEEAEKIGKKIKLIMQSENIGAIELEIVSGVSWPSIYRARKGIGGININSIIKILTALGYELQFVKVAPATRAENNPVLLQELIKKRKYNEDAKRKERKQPIRTGTRTKTKRSKSIVALSTRKSIDGFTSKGNFLSAD